MELGEQKKLIEACINGERSAQYALYKQYCKAMYNISYRITNDSDDAEDVLQEAFISAFKNLKSFKGESSFGAWLKRIVVNASLNHIKKQKMLYTPIEDIDIPQQEVLNNEDLVLETEKVKEAIQLLPDGFRTVFSLYLLEGYDHREIADILGISESTSKSQYNRAKKKLRELLQEKVYENG